MKVSLITMGKSASPFVGSMTGVLMLSVNSTVAVALWALTPNATVAPDLQLTLDKIVDGGILNVVPNNSKWSPLGRQ